MKNLKTKEIILTMFSLVGKIVGRTKLQKIIFLLKEEQRIPVGVDFQIYLYGPFSRELNNEMDVLISEGLIDSKETMTRSGDTCYEYAISEEGMKKGMDTLEKLPKDKREKIIKHTAKFNLMTPTEIVKYVYDNYPDAKP